MPTIEEIFPEYIHTDGDTQPRERIDEAVCKEYAERIQAGDKFPPSIVYYDGENHWLADGFHRHLAYLHHLPSLPMPCEIRQGTQADAQWYSYSANRDHGVPRTRKDKIRAIESALRHAQGAQESDRAIADHLGVSYSTVAKYRERLELSSGAQIGHLEKRTGRDGKQYPAQGSASSEKKRGKPKGKRKTTKPSRHMASMVQPPTRTPVPMEKMTALSLPHNPVMGARTLIEVFDKDYLRVLVDEIAAHLENTET